MDLTEMLIEIYEQQVNTGKIERKLSPIENKIALRRKIDTFHVYHKYLQGKSRFLDWGCKDAIDACLIRKTATDEVEIHGCDVQQGKRYEIFGREANLIYSQLNHYYQLPYEDNYFDAVIGSGVLEHVPNDRESLKELYRIIKEEGYLIINFLPNIWSYTESINRFFRNKGHKRKYSLSQIKKVLLHTGFVPVEWGYHQLAPSLVSLSSPGMKSKRRLLQPLADRIYKLNQYAEKIYPINQLAANVFVIAQKKSMI